MNVQLSSIVSRKAAAKAKQIKVRKELEALNQQRQELKHEVNLSHNEKLAIIGELVNTELSNWQRPMPFSDGSYSESAALGVVTVDYVCCDCPEATNYKLAVNEFKLAYKNLIAAKVDYIKVCIARGVTRGLTVNLNKLVKRDGV